LTLTFAPTRTHRIGLVAGLVAVLLLLVGVLLTWPRGRRSKASRAEPAAIGHKGLPRPAVWLVTAAVAGLASGVWGLLIAVGVCLLPRRWLAAAGAVALALAGVVMATLGVADVQSAGAIFGQLLGTVTLAALARATTEPPRSPACRPIE